MFWAPWHQTMSTYSQPSFSNSTWKRSGAWMCKVCVISREQLNIAVKLLLSANRKLYMPRRLAQQWMTLSDLEWPFHTKIDIIRTRYLCGKENNKVASITPGLAKDTAELLSCCNDWGLKQSTSHQRCCFISCFNCDGWYTKISHLQRFFSANVFIKNRFCSVFVEAK